MEADHLRENPQTPQQQETRQAITYGCKRLRLLLAANNQATRRNEIKQHPACPNKKQNHLQKSLLRRTQFWVRKTFSKPASLKMASVVALPVAMSHKASLKPKRLRFCNLDTKTSKHEPKHGPKNGPAWRSHFWDRMHNLVKEQKKSTFTVPFLGPSGGTKNETAKSQKQEQRPTRAIKKSGSCIWLSNKQIDSRARKLQFIFCYDRTCATTWRKPWRRWTEKWATSK